MNSTMENNASTGSDGGGSSLNKKIKSLVIWVWTCIASAFFLSLEFVWCANLSMSDSDDENEEEAKDHPFMFAPAAGDMSHCVAVDKLPV